MKLTTYVNFAGKCADADMLRYMLDTIMLSF